GGTVRCGGAGYWLQVLVAQIGASVASVCCYCMPFGTARFQACFAPLRALRRYPSRGSAASAPFESAFCLWQWKVNDKHLNNLLSRFLTSKAEIILRQITGDGENDGMKCLGWGRPEDTDTGKKVQ